MRFTQASLVAISASIVFIAPSEALRSASVFDDEIPSEANQSINGEMSDEDVSSTEVPEIVMQAKEGLSEVGSTISVVSSAVRSGLESVRKHIASLDSIVAGQAVSSSCFLLAAVAVKTLGAVFMKRSMGFCDLKFSGLAFICSTCNVRAMLVLFDLFPPHAGRVSYSILQYVSVALFSFALYREQAMLPTAVALFLGLSGMLGLALSPHGYGDSFIGIAELPPVQLQLTACISAAGLFLSASRIDWLNGAGFVALKAGAMLAAVVFEVLSYGALLALHASSSVALVFTALICNWASTAGLVVLLDLMDLHTGWSIYSSLVYIGIDAVVMRRFEQVPDVVDGLSLGMVLSSVIILCMADHGYFRNALTMAASQKQKLIPWLITPHRAVDENQG